MDTHKRAQLGRQSEASQHDPPGALPTAGPAGYGGECRRGGLGGQCRCIKAGGRFGVSWQPVRTCLDAFQVTNVRFMS